MEYNPQVHRRRSVRLRRYDYSSPGAYFVTICTYQRELTLVSDFVQRGVESTWRGLAERFPSVVVDEFVIMPNHVHGIIMLEGAASSAPTLGHIVRAFKSVSAIAANKALGRSGHPFWQRNYYEHVIRDEEELNEVRRYIWENPLKWSDDPDNPANL